MKIRGLARLLALAAATAAMGTPVPAVAQAVSVEATVHADQPGPLVSRYLFGQFAEHLGTGIYGGVWVGEGSKIPNTHGFRNDVLDALRALKVPVIRWPGGCFADEYHWRDGIGPRARRPVRVNTHWGGVTETNAFGTHEFLEFAGLVGADAYVAANAGSAGPEEAAEWVEYMTSASGSSLANERRANGRDAPWNVPFVGVGNELWGCGGNMRAEYAADIYRRYQTFVKAPPDRPVKKIAPGANVDDTHWTEVMMREARNEMDGVSLHYYTFTGTWDTKGSSTDFDEREWIGMLARALAMDGLIAKHAAIMDRYDPGKRVALVVDEWGSWYLSLPGTNPGFLQQQNTLRDALVAAIHLNIFQQHADRVRMANLAQMVNVLQALILTSEERMVLTPTYHVFDLYKPFRDATHLPLEVKSPLYSFGGTSVPAVQAAAARGTDGLVHVALVNLDPHRAARVVMTLQGVEAHAVRGRILTAPAINSLNSFEKPATVRPQAFSAARVHGNQATVELPEKSVVVLDFQ